MNKTRAERSVTGQVAVTTDWQVAAIPFGTSRFMLHSDQDLLISFEETPVDAEAFKLPANTVMDWADQVGTISVKGAAAGTAWWVS